MRRLNITSEQLTALRHELARLLGEGWSYTPDPDHSWYNTMIKREDGASITVGSASQAGMVVIGGWSANYGETGSRYDKLAMPTIRVAYERGAAIIHKEIVRRFLPDFSEALKGADEYVAERNRHRALSESTFDAIFAVFTLRQGKPRHQRNDEGGGMIHFGEVGKGYGDMRIKSAESVDVTVQSLDRERAVRLAAFLTTL